MPNLMPFLLRHFVLAVLRAVKNEPAVRMVIARSKKPDTSPKDWFSGISDETWFWMNTTGCRRRKAIADLLPHMPEVAMQELLTGHSGDSTLGEGFNAYKIFKNCYETHIGPIESCRAILDFGCGWGRTIRFFLKDLQPEKLLGIDHDEKVIRACRNTNKWCRFKLVEPDAPTPLRQESFDLIYLYSVFSHLPEEMHWAWLKEFHRLLAPGGLLIATTRARDFIQECKTFRDDPLIEGKPDWIKFVSRSFLDVDAWMLAYDNGQFCYDSHGLEGRWSYWGEACIPKGYVEKRWKELFDMCGYIDDPNICRQNVIVVRKRG
jgi:SAM-dependent methyltransferase